MDNQAGLERTSPERHLDHGLATVTVDGQPKQVPKGEYVVSRFKQLVGVDSNRALDEVVNGEFKPLDDSAHIKIHGGELFVSHVRTGSSS
jgi:hypothetical protein